MGTFRISPETDMGNKSAFREERNVHISVR